MCLDVAIQLVCCVEVNIHFSVKFLKTVVRYAEDFNRLNELRKSEAQFLAVIIAVDGSHTVTCDFLFIVIIVEVIEIVVIVILTKCLVKALILALTIKKCSCNRSSTYCCNRSESLTNLVHVNQSFQFLSVFHGISVAYFLNTLNVVEV